MEPLASSSQASPHGGGAPSHSSRTSRTSMSSCRLPTHNCSRLVLIKGPPGGSGPPGGRPPLPLFEDKPDVDVLLQAADPQLLAVGADQGAHGGQRTSRGVRVDGRVMDPEHSPFRSNRYDQL